MRLKKERIAILAKNIVEGLIDKKCVNPLIPKGDFITKIDQTITEEMMIEDRLNEEVREILKTHSKQIEQGSINYNRMFQMIKNKLIQERGIII